MSTWLTKPVDYVKATLTVVKSLGPWLISQTEASSKAYAEHQERMGKVEIGKEVGKELLMQEIHLYGEVKKTLLGKWIDANSHEKVRIKRDLEDVEASIRGIKVGAKALNYLLPPNQEQTAAAEPTSARILQSEVTEHWMDRFRELATARNEPWREDLLARALAQESSHPGSVSPRCLWLIGTLTEMSFNVFATLMDIATYIAGKYVILESSLHYKTLAENSDPRLAMPLGSLLYYISDAGLLSGNSSGIEIPPEGGGLVTYHTEQYIIETDKTLYVQGMMHSILGVEIAQFYQPKAHPLGKILLEEWMTKLSKLPGYTVNKLVPTDTEGVRTMVKLGEI